VTRPGAFLEDGTREVEHVHKIRLADKRAALVDLGKHLGMFVDRHEHTGKDGAPLIDLSDMEMARRMVAILDRATNQ
jgi:phage terminase small subunit